SRRNECGPKVALSSNRNPDLARVRAKPGQHYRTSNSSRMTDRILITPLTLIAFVSDWLGMVARQLRQSTSRSLRSLTALAIGVSVASLCFLKRSVDAASDAASFWLGRSSVMTDS